MSRSAIGGDIRIDNVRGRFLCLCGGLWSVTTTRNDPSVVRGSWDLSGAYKYVAEGWGGYHWDSQHGVNLDAGIFVSYIGLFSYYNFDNWTYQPSFVSSNTPWFFNGVRLQWFPHGQAEDRAMVHQRLADLCAAQRQARPGRTGSLASLGMV